jgi:hypothetical protein
MHRPQLCGRALERPRDRIAGRRMPVDVEHRRHVVLNVDLNVGQIRILVIEQCLDGIASLVQMHDARGRKAIEECAAGRGVRADVLSVDEFPELHVG